MKRGTGPMRRMGGGVDGRWNGMGVDGGESTARWTVTTTAVMFDIHTPEQACTTYRGKLRTCVSAGVSDHAETYRRT